MSNSLRSAVDVTVCGRPAQIRPTFLALDRIEHRLGFGIPELLSRLNAGDIRLGQLAVCVQEGLRGAGFSGANGKGDFASYEEIGEDVCENFSRYVDAIAKFCGDALGKGTDLGKDLAPPPAP
jgi:hypothetical protein